MFSRRMVFAIAGAFFVFCSVILISVSDKHPDATEGISSVPISIISPFQDAVTGSITFISGIWRHYFDLVSTAKENDALKKMLSQAVEKKNQCVEIELSNQRLRKFLDFQKTRMFQTVSAEVIGKDPSPWSKTVIIDKGQSDGIRKGCPVVVPEGITGQVVSVSTYYSKVLLIIDRNSAIDALVQRSRARGIIRGMSSEECTFHYVLRKNDIRVGDEVVSSGIDGVYPKGLRIGYVSGVIRRNSGMFQEVDVTPHVDFEKLEEVIVFITPAEYEFEMP
ncbi:MAG: rod shape-determining protein MreC [Deltaproteobacteria bacterium]|nr:MAG: rod shape-determining protein MreC [Deltaproteobacteria bacterium]